MHVLTHREERERESEWPKFLSKTKIGKTLKHYRSLSEQNNESVK